MTTKNLERGRRKNAKRAQRKYLRLEPKVPMRCPPNVDRQLDRVVRLDRLAWRGWGHLIGTIVESLNRSVNK